MRAKRISVIGGGPGGYVAAIRAAQLGADVTLVEKDEIGGTCLNRGCIPTKALLHDAQLLRAVKQSPVFQPLLPDPFNPLPLMMERKEKVIRELVKGIELLLDSYRVKVKVARAELLAPYRMILLYRGGEKEVIESDAIVLALGSKSKILPGLTPDGERIITSDEALGLQTIPSEVVIVGGGYIGVELATFFNALGSRVTVVEILDTILPGLEGELVRNLRRVLERDGVGIRTGSSVEEVHPSAKGLKIMIKTPQGIEEVTADHLLVAVGRRPNLELDFEKAGVEIGPEGIRVNHRMETTVPNIYAVGDAIGGAMLAHVAMEEGIVAAEHIMGMDRHKKDQSVPICIFSQPEIASVGLTEKEARGKGEVKIGRFPFRSNPKAVTEGATEGLVKVVADRESGQILGIHIIGREASSLISAASILVTQGMTVKEFSKMIQAHPTYAEALKEAALDVGGAAIHLPKPLRAKA